TIAPGLTLGRGPARWRAHAQRVQEQSAMAPKIPMRDPDLQVAEQKKPELMSIGPERYVLLMSEQLAEAVEGDFVRPPRPQLLAVRPREFPGEQRSIRLGPPAPIRFAVQRLEHRVELGTLQPGAVAFRESTHTLLYGPIAARPQPCRREQPPCRLVRIRVRRPRERLRRPQPADPERPQRLAHELAQRVQPFSATGTSHTVPSGGNVRSADCGWPSQGTSSTAMRSGLPTPEPP